MKRAFVKCAGYCPYPAVIIDIHEETRAYFFHEWQYIIMTPSSVMLPLDAMDDMIKLHGHKKGYKEALRQMVHMTDRQILKTLGPHIPNPMTPYSRLLRKYIQAEQYPSKQLITILTTLQSFEIDVETLIQSRIGKAIRYLSKLKHKPLIQHEALKLIRKWNNLVNI